jgi:hypothetical protein
MPETRAQKKRKLQHTPAQNTPTASLQTSPTTGFSLPSTQQTFPPIAPLPNVNQSSTPSIVPFNVTPITSATLTPQNLQATNANQGSTTTPVQTHANKKAKRKAPSASSNPSTDVTSNKKPKVDIKETKQKDRPRVLAIPEGALAKQVQPKGQPTQTDQYEDSAKKNDIVTEGTQQAGFFPQDDVQHVELPEEVDYSGNRRRQVLHHFSEAMRYHLEQQPDPNPPPQKQPKPKKQDSNKPPKKLAKAKPPKPQNLKPVEVQTRYEVAKDGSLSIYVGANQPKSQEYMAELSQAKLTKIFDDLADTPIKDTDKNKELARARKSASKLKNIKGQNERRREKDAKRKKKGKATKEDEADLKRSEEIAQQLTGNIEKLTVVKNPEERHVEQGLVFVGDKDAIESDVAGTLIRCGACTSELGADRTMIDLAEAHDEDFAEENVGRQASGKDYPSQAALKSWADTHRQRREGVQRVAVNRSKRARSLSPARKDET